MGTGEPRDTGPNNRNAFGRSGSAESCPRDAANEPSHRANVERARPRPRGRDASHRGRGEACREGFEPGDRHGGAKVATTASALAGCVATVPTAACEGVGGSRYQVGGFALSGEEGVGHCRRIDPQRTARAARAGYQRRDAWARQGKGIALRLNAQSASVKFSRSAGAHAPAVSMSAARGSLPIRMDYRLPSEVTGRAELRRHSLGHP
jgi:hypothetical protein